MSTTSQRTWAPRINATQATRHAAGLSLPSGSEGAYARVDSRTWQATKSTMNTALWALLGPNHPDHTR
jgi:hypothetical protein